MRILVYLLPTMQQEQTFLYHKVVVDMLEAYDKFPRKSEEILSTQFELSYNKANFRRTCQFIFLTLLRNKFFIEYALDKFCSKPPKQKIKAVLQSACAELLNSDKEKKFKIIHNWVEFTKKNFSKAESGFVNAVLRKCLCFFDNPQFENLNEIEKLSIIYSNPVWLTKRWIKDFGSHTTKEILELNKKASDVFFRKSPNPKANTLLEKYSDIFELTHDSDFLKLKSGNWEFAKKLLNSELFYVQDPSTLNAPRLLNPQPDKKYLDLCASPGGKSRAIADIILQNSITKKKNKLENLGTLVSVDLEQRIKPLKENLSKIDFLNTNIIPCDILNQNLKEKLKEKNLPIKFDGVFLDAPCSNTGVLRRRPDAKYRIKEKDISSCANIQSKLLDISADFVEENSFLVYSTCSIDKSENEDIAQQFLENHKNFKLIFGKTFLPNLQSDGCGAFLFQHTI